MRRGRKLAVGVAAGALVLTAAGCGTQSTGGKTKIVVWTQQADPVGMAAQQKVINWIEKQMPNVTIELDRKPGVAAGDNTQLITAVRGNVAPDLMLTDRFGVIQQAALGMLKSLTPYIKKDEAAGKGNVTKKYLPFAVGEGAWKGQNYALPYDTDDRALVYNKEVLQKAGVDISKLDPKNGPITISELQAMAAKVDKKDSHGNYTQVGIVPWWGQGEPATWMMGFGAKFFDNKTCRVTATEPAAVKAYTLLDNWVSKLNYTKLQAFLAAYAPPNAPPTISPIYQNRFGFEITGNWDMANFKNYAPKMKYGVTYLPVEKKGQPPSTWAGGFALTMPKGTKGNHGQLAWEVMKLYDSAYGQKVFMTATSHLPTYTALLKDPQVIKGQEFFAKQLSFARSRVPLPIGAFLWNDQETEQDAVLLGKHTPMQAAETIQKQTDSMLKMYCPFKAVFAKPAGAVN
ncbi:hypothetical protein BIV57_19380 [Mangrovactinospora gilvigrisea]|uniref:ABC transporter substrate-binding protein n=1 Tax=Mangrovactinospora gilvigrisea TaxID=1428644 RepID=A0A1J7C2T7_9ACTN|nr:hypothetical protein [Mangrovactinospora gilvigrisea]OIV35880.1 hypothetical protein BIV57_19380 [Mangrovactinospora gilvigrisea]